LEFRYIQLRITSLTFDSGESVKRNGYRRDRSVEVSSTLE
jgi:hypothetical protein